MQSLSCYQSSDSDGESDQYPELCSPPPPPPPPEDITGVSLRGLSDVSLSLPAVAPISVDGNYDHFLVHVHIPVTHPELCVFTERLMALTRLALVDQPIKASFIPVSDLHVSLSLATTIRSKEVHQLLRVLRRHICRFSQTTIQIHCSLHPFFSGDKSRAYVAAPATAISDSKERNNDADFLLQLISAVNAAYASCCLPPHFATPIPHMSFAWTDKLDMVSVLSKPLVSPLSKQRSIYMDVKYVVCDVGKIRHTFKLRAPLLRTQ